MTDDTDFRAGFVAVVGRPNVGKSTLINALVGSKVSIVTAKPQTTRHRILGVLSTASAQVILVDTPGMHRSGGKAMNRVMNRAAANALLDADLVLFVVEANRWTEEDADVLNRIRESGRPAIVVLNKVDTVHPKDAILAALQRLSEQFEFEEMIPVSARDGTNLDVLLQQVPRYLPPSPPLFPEDMRTDKSREFQAAETIREKLTLMLHQELPYGLTVQVERFAETAVVIGIDRKKPGKHARLDLLKAGQRLGARPPVIGQRVTDRRAVDFLDTGNDVAHFAGADALQIAHLRREYADAIGKVTASGGHDAHLAASFEHAVDDAHEADDAHVVVEPGVDDQRLQRCVRVALRRRHARHELLEQFMDSQAGLGADLQRVRRVDADDFLDLVFDLVAVGRRQVDLVQHRQHLEPLLDGGVAVGDALRLDALRGVDHQQRAFAGGERARHFVGEIDVARRIDEVELVLAAVVGAVRQRYALRLDGDSPLALQVHAVEHLGGHLALGQAAADLDEAVRERRLAVIDVSDDREIANIVHAFRKLVKASFRSARNAPHYRRKSVKSPLSGSVFCNFVERVPVQVTAAQLGAGLHQDRHRGAIACLQGRIAVHVDDVHVQRLALAKEFEFDQHVVAQVAAATGVERQPHGGPRSAALPLSVAGRSISRASGIHAA